jgi:hypothetical protein
MLCAGPEFPAGLEFRVFDRDRRDEMVRLILSEVAKAT